MKDDNYPENFWPKIITLLSIGAFIYWVMTTPDADKTIHTYLLDPLLSKLKNNLETALI